MTPRHLAVAALAVLTAAGCSSSAKPAAAPATTSAATTAASAATTSAATTSAAPTATTTTADTAPKLGATQTLSDSGTVIQFTVSGYSARRVGANAELLAADDRIATVTVKACLKAATDPTGFDWHAWQLVFADGSTATPVSAYAQRDFTKPLYPNTGTGAVPVGDCRSGLIPFDIPSGQAGDPVKVEYSNGADVLEWAQ